MSTEKTKLEQLLDHLEARHELTRKEFCKNYGVKWGNLKRWQKLDSTYEKGFRFDLIVALAKAFRTSPAAIYRNLDIDVNVVPKGGTQPFENFKLLGLVSELMKEDDDKKKALQLAWEGRRSHCYDESLPTALKLYKQAFSKAIEVREPRLATYIQIHMLNINEMIGDFTEAARLYGEILKDVTSYQEEGSRSSSRLLKKIGERLAAQAKFQWLSTRRWTHGSSLSIIKEGILLLDEFQQCHAYQKIPHLLIFLARCSLEVGEVNQALYYAEHAQLWVYMLKHPNYTPYELFLDAGGSFSDGTLDYSWQEDRILAARADILIAAGYPERAFQIYCLIREPYRPQSYMVFYHWQNPQWQAFKENQSTAPEMRDEKFVTTFEQWDGKLLDSGHAGAQILNLYCRGEYAEAQHAYRSAFRYFEDARNLALDREKGAMIGLGVKCGLAASIAAAKGGYRKFALQSFNMVQDKVEHLDNPLLIKMKEKAEEALAQL